MGVESPLALLVRLGLQGRLLVQAVAFHGLQGQLGVQAAAVHLGQLGQLAVGVVPQAQDSQHASCI